MRVKAERRVDDPERRPDRRERPPRDPNARGPNAKRARKRAQAEAAEKAKQPTAAEQAEAKRIQDKERNKARQDKKEGIASDGFGYMSAFVAPSFISRDHSGNQVLRGSDGSNSEIKANADATKRLIWVMGPPGCGKTSMLREMLFQDSEYEQKWFETALKDGVPLKIPYWWLPAWHGAVIGCTDQHPDYRSYQQYREAAASPGFDPRTYGRQIEEAARISSSEGHGGISWVEAAALLQPDCQEDYAHAVSGLPSWSYLFVEGYGPNNDFAEIAITEGWIISAYWIDVSQMTSKQRMLPSEEVNAHWAQVAQMKELARKLQATRIDGEQEFDAVMADVWTAIMQDILPANQIGNLNRDNFPFPTL